MDEFDKYIRENAFYDFKEGLKSCDIGDILENFTLKEIGSGSNTRVYITEDKKWVIKEGRWDLSLSTFKYLGLQFTPALTEQLVKTIDIEFMPTKEHTVNQYQDFLLFTEYFGYFSEDDFLAQKYPDLIGKQRAVRMQLEELISKVRDFNSFPISASSLWNMISGVSETNFLVDEYLLYGKSIHKSNQGKDTSYIVQKYVKGDMFHDQENGDLGEIVTSKLVLLALLILIMDMLHDRVPDMRPRYFIQESKDWFSNTDNIILSNSDVFFIDTRWLWNKNDHFIKRGLLIPEMTVESAKAFIYKAIEGSL